MINIHSRIKKIVAIIILAILLIGLISTFDQAFFHMGAVGRDIYWLSIFFIITFILLVQFILIKILGRVKKVAKLINSIVILNMISMIGTFICFSIYKFFTPYSGLDGIIRWVLIDLLWPAGMVWGRNNLISSTIFATLSIAIVTPMLYNILKKDTTSKKLLLTSIMTSSTICYTCITIFFHIKY